MMGKHRGRRHAGNLSIRARIPVRAAFAAVAAFVAAVPSARAAGPQPGARQRPTETLQGLVRELVALQVEAKSEDTRWREEKAHLETTLSLLGSEGARLERNLASARAEADVNRTERERLTAEIEKAESLLRSTDEFVRSAGRRLLKTFEGLPAPLRKPLADGASRVRDALSAETKGRGVAKRLQLIIAFAADLDRTLSSVHAVKQVIDAPGGERREADVLYVGGAVGYYVFPGEDQAGLLVRGPKGWGVSPRNDIARAVGRALAIFRKESLAALVELPVPPGDDNASGAESPERDARDDRTGGEQ